MDLQARTAKLSDKQELRFEKALIATGANVRRLNVPGCELEQIHYLRTLGNADAIREGVADAEKVVLIGGSYIGCEVAASLTMMGKQATIVMQEQATLERGFGKQRRTLLPGAARIARHPGALTATSWSASRATTARQGGRVARSSPRWPGTCRPKRSWWARA